MTIATIKMYKSILQKENSKHVIDRDFDYIFLLEKTIKRIETIK